MNRTLPRARRAAAIAILLGTIGSARAANGLNLIGHGAESVGMAGADLAIARDTSALNTNPAGLAIVDGAMLDVYAVAFEPLGLTHRDELGNDVVTDHGPALGMDLGYAWRLRGSPVVVGLGMFGQGGGGNQYARIRTGFGNRDDVSATFGLGKLTLGAAGPAGRRLRVGAALTLAYARMDQEMFADTSRFDPGDPASTFFGVRLSDLSATSTGYKVGLMYDVDSRLTVAAAYTSPIDLRLSGGSLRVDMTAAGLGRVVYDEAAVGGMGFPREVGAGAAWRPDPWTLLSFELTWIEWSDALRRSTLEASGPDTAGAPETIRSRTPMDWRDQYVLAVGLARDLGPRSIVRAGLNLARNPVPDATATPIFPAFARCHVTIGGGYALTPALRLDGAIEYQARAAETYTNASLPFGADARDQTELIALHVSSQVRW